METATGIYIGLVCFALGIVASYIWIRTARWYARSELNVKAKAKSTANQEEFESELAVSVTEVMQSIQNGKTPADALKETAIRHPKVAFRMAKKLKLPGLEGF